MELLTLGAVSGGHKTYFVGCHLTFEASACKAYPGIEFDLRLVGYLYQ